MSDPDLSSTEASSAEDFHSAVFGNLVLQNANMAMIFLGKVPHPETGERMQDLETARLFIDQLEMLEAKTKGNLNKQEVELLRQSLMAVRLAYVEAADKAPSSAKAAAGTSPEPATDAPIPPTGEAAHEKSPSTAEADERKKFVKKY